MAAGKINFFSGPEAPGVDHQEGGEANKNQPRNGDPPLLDGIGVEEKHRTRQPATRGGNRHAHEVFSVRTAGVSRLRVGADVESRQARSAAQEEKKTDERAGLHKVLPQLRIHGIGKKMKSPDERQQTWRHAKRDHIGQGIQFPAEVTRGIGHARDAAIKRVKGNSKKNGDRRPVQVHVRLAAAIQCRNGLRDGEVAGSEAAGGEERRQQIHAPPQTRMGFARCLNWNEGIHELYPRGIDAKMLAPPLTRSPTFTRSAAFAGITTSTRDPNLMRPTRCPRSTDWPSLQRNTMRRAKRPAICLKVTSNPASAPWPRTVTVFCSLRSAEAGFMAFRNLPF